MEIYKVISKETISGMVRDEMVPIYAQMLFDNASDYDVRRINTMIIDRWSTSALIYIKEKAWKAYDPTGEKFRGKI